jgi:hypothetical protein
VVFYSPEVSKYSKGKGKLLSGKNKKPRSLGSNTGTCTTAWLDFGMAVD